MRVFFSVLGRSPGVRYKNTGLVLMSDEKYKAGGCREGAAGAREAWMDVFRKAQNFVLFSSSRWEGGGKSDSKGGGFCFDLVWQEGVIVWGWVAGSPYWAAAETMFEATGALRTKPEAWRTLLSGRAQTGESRMGLRTRAWISSSDSNEHAVPSSSPER